MVLLFREEWRFRGFWRVKNNTSDYVVLVFSVILCCNADDYVVMLIILLVGLKVYVLGWNFMFVILCALCLWFCVIVFVIFVLCIVLSVYVLFCVFCVLYSIVLYCVL
jgi:hypothetical protein